MSRLQDYFKTPNPIQPQFFTPQSCQQQDPHNLFIEQEAQQTKGPDESFFQGILRSPKATFFNRRTPIVVITPVDGRKIINERLEFDDVPQEDMLTPVKQKQGSKVMQTTANKKYDLRVPGISSPMLVDGKEGERTLRLLTAQAYNVVCKKGATTYKMVAEEIIFNTTDMPSSKEQKNIKRRVYDALNVLIALGKLDKKGRRIMPKKCHEKQRAHRQKVAELKRILAQKQSMLKSKQKFKKEELKKSNCLRKLIDKNSNEAKKNLKFQKIKMPFILTCQDNFKGFNSNQENRINLSLKKESHKIFCTDIDAITYLKFENK